MGLEGLAGGRDGVSNDDDVVGIVVFHSGNEAYAYGQELSFDGSDVHSLNFELFEFDITIP